MTSQVRVQRLAFASGPDSWSVVADDGLIAPVERFLAHLTAIEQSPNTVRAYAHDLRDYFDFLRIKDLPWNRVSLEDIGAFVAWLRLPRSARQGERVVPLFERGVGASTVNRKLSALSSFYEFHRRHGVDLGELTTTWKFGSTRRGSWKPLLAHLGSREERRRQVALPVERRQPRALSEPEVATLLGACDSLASRLLLTVLRYAGFRIGEALGLRHEDVDARRCELSIVNRENVNSARPKSRARTVPVSRELIRLYSDYLHDEYGALDNDYVFVQFGGKRAGHALDYRAVDGLVRRLRRRSGIQFTPHDLRHSYATDLLRRGVPAEVVQRLLGHASISTTIDTYSHLGVEDARRALVNAGILVDGR